MGELISTSTQTNEKEQTGNASLNILRKSSEAKEKPPPLMYGGDIRNDWSHVL